MAHGGRTAVNIRGFYSTVRCCNQGKAVAPRCLSGFDYVPTQSTSLFDSLTCPWSRNRRRDRGQIISDCARISFFGLYWGDAMASIHSLEVFMMKDN